MTKGRAPPLRPHEDKNAFLVFFLRFQSNWVTLEWDQTGEGGGGAPRWGAPYALNQIGKGGLPLFPMDLWAGAGWGTPLCPVFKVRIFTQYHSRNGLDLVCSHLSTYVDLFNLSTSFVASRHSRIYFTSLPLRTIEIAGKWRTHSPSLVWAVNYVARSPYPWKFVCSAWLFVCDSEFQRRKSLEFGSRDLLILGKPKFGFNVWYLMQHMENSNI